MSYDIKYRQRAIDYWNAGHSKKETSAVFKVGSTTLQAWKSQLKETGTLAPKVRRQTWRKVDPKKLKEYLKEHPDAYLREIAEVFLCTEVAIFKALKRLRISRKKNDSLQGN
ncbi:MAG: transposase [Oscillospiraceae bacterium]|jgi:transposase|nr:transposase [Oscillospiraceae bacterium]